MPAPNDNAEDARFLSALEAWWSGERRDGAGRPMGSDGADRIGGGGTGLPEGLMPLGRASTPSHSPAPPGTIDRPTARKIARRRVPLEGRIDLHGMDQETAYGALLGFLRRSRDEGRRHVIVITGKGRGTGEGVLKRAVPRWLATEPFRGLVSGVREAARHDGGAGALYVKLRRSRG